MHTRWQTRIWTEFGSCGARIQVKHDVEAVVTGVTIGAYDTCQILCINTRGMTYEADKVGGMDVAGC
jgi:hypothetical protein